MTHIQGLIISCFHLLTRCRGQATEPKYQVQQKSMKLFSFPWWAKDLFLSQMHQGQQGAAQLMAIAVPLQTSLFVRKETSP